MARRIAELIEQLEIDPWRETTGFSADLESVQSVLWRPGLSDDDRVQALAQWIGSESQPCLFGRMAAKRGFLTICVVPEEVLMDSDEAIRDQIQAARLAWTQEGYRGSKSGFVVLAASESIARAKPNAALMELACRLCSLYLLKDIVPDEIFHDTIELEKPGPERVAWQWLAGVNYFSSQGDQRWWYDHRIPGGMAFSTNSVGHLVKSGILAKMMQDVDAALGVDSEEWSLSKVDSLHKAHALAMRTISLAAETVSGKATSLLSLPVGVNTTGLPTAIVDAFPDKDPTQYVGYYHTDVTVPSEYFRPDVERPADLKPHVLDFTYLFDDSIENPDHVTMGAGRRIREDGEAEAQPVSRADIRRLQGEIVPIDSCDRLSSIVEKESLTR